MNKYAKGFADDPDSGTGDGGDGGGYGGGNDGISS